MIPLLPRSFDPSRMMYCYMVDKWNMPSCSKMSALAYRTYNSILGHIGVFHMPTFRLNVGRQILRPISYICSLRCFIRRTHISGSASLCAQLTALILIYGKRLRRNLAMIQLFKASWRSLVQILHGWKDRKLCKKKCVHIPSNSFPELLIISLMLSRQKTELIVKAVYNSQKLTKLRPDDALPMIHALLLYNSKTFLSENRTERLSGEAYLATIISVSNL